MRFSTPDQCTMFSESSLIIGREIFLQIFQESDQKWSTIFFVIVTNNNNSRFFVIVIFVDNNNFSPLIHTVPCFLVQESYMIR